MRFRLLCSGFAAVMLIALGAPLADTAHAVTTRTISGTVTSSGTVFPGGGAIACPFINGSPTPTCDPSHWTVGIVDAGGQYTMQLDATTQYYLFGIADFGSFNSQAAGTPHFRIVVADPAGAAVPGQNFDVPFPGTTFSGTLTRTGFSVFAPQTAGVGACPQPLIDPTKTGAQCIGLRSVYANSDGSYQLRLRPGTWKVAGFIFIDGVPVIGADVETISVSDGVGQTLNLSADVATPDDGDGNPATASVPAQDAGAGGTLALTTSDGLTPLENVASFPASNILTPPPAGVVFQNGVVSFTAGPLPAGVTTVTVVIEFPSDVPSGTDWYKLGPTGWAAFPGATWLDARHLQITIEDGGAGDDDGQPNGYVTDPGALGLTPLITFAPLADKTYGDAPFNVTATANTGLPVSFDAAAGSNCSVLNATVTITGAGHCSVVASQSGNATFPAAQSVTRTFQIARAAQTITFPSLANRAYGAPAFAPTATSSSGLPVTYAAGPANVCTFSGGLVTLTGVGSCTVTATQSGDANFQPAAAVSRTFNVGPASKDQCKNGGWSFGPYKNQGDCVDHFSKKK